MTGESSSIHESQAKVEGKRERYHSAPVIHENDRKETCKYLKTAGLAPILLEPDQGFTNPGWSRNRVFSRGCG